MSAPVTIDRLDHLVLTVRDIEKTCDFYQRVLGMEVRAFGPDQRKALHFGRQKINLHQAGHEFEPKALRPTPGSGDLCFITTQAIGAVERHVNDCGVAIEDGPVERTGAMGRMMSIYFRDPDGNLIEVSTYI
jgi:catechol 2,3-dioxygenase-like lactoylglutathione lyase family enzyme